MVITIEDLRAGLVDFSDIDDTEGKRLDPIHPGDILSDWMAEEGLSANALAKALKVPHNRITAITAGKRAVSAETALRLARYFGTSADLWMNLQAGYDQEVAERTQGERIASEVQPRQDIPRAA
jgi:antitoxin HigA-1